jgi:RHS repeat-associated protein
MSQATDAQKGGNAQSLKENGENKSFAISPPSVSLPKGGGAIRGMGEKFAANPVTGTGSMSVPIATSPGRSGFGPQLSLSYDSGAGNGPFGFGWNLSLPSITRKTDKGLPQYFDAQDSDVFILSGAEDLVPEFEKGPAGNWVLNAGKHVIVDKPRTVAGVTYNVRRYRPRIEGLFALIERWTRVGNPHDVHWRSISKDNILTLYGRNADSRIVDPEDASRIFSWLICETRDDKGNAVLYGYKREDGAGVDLARANERNRGAADDARRTANRYLKRIVYGNRTTLLDSAGHRPLFLTQGQLDSVEWMFKVVFDYGEHYDEDIAAQKSTVDFSDTHRPWPVREDPFSTYRAGFEVRTYRLCRRVLMFHHFDELGTGNYLVKSTGLHHDESPVFSLVRSIKHSSYERDQGNVYHKRSLPPLEFKYSEAKIHEDIRELDDESLRNLPEGLDGVRYQWVDLDGEGLTGILTEQADAWYYKRNIGGGKFAEQELVARKPSLAALASGGQQLLDLAGDGQLDLVELDRPLAGFYERSVDEDWEPFVPFKSLPDIAWQDPNLKFIDLTGDGHADVLISEDDAFTWYGSLAEAGFGPAKKVTRALEEESGPRLVFADGTQSIYLADMSGDGLTDLVRIRNGEVCYWPNLGYGRFGAKVTMDHAPRFDYPDQFDQRRIRLADIDGSGVVDILYLATDGIRIYFNQSGNQFDDARTLSSFPKTDNLSAVQVADLFGNGTACLLWSSPLPGAARRPLRFIDLMGGNKPHLLIKTKNNLGGKTIVEYVASTQFYLADKLAGNPWITKLPFPAHVVAKTTAIDDWRNTKFSSTYSYHHGYFDGIEREFRGFGRVEQTDVEKYGHFAAGNVASPWITDDQTLYQPPIKTITWYHTGAAIDRQRILTQFATEYFPARFPQQQGFAEKALPEPELAADLSAEEWREALRACKGMVLRQESYELDVDALHAQRPREVPVRLYSAATHNCHIARLQPKASNQHAVFLVTESEAITYNYELDLRGAQLQPDPRIAHTLNLRHDEYGNPQQSIAIGYGRVASGRNSHLPRAELIDQVQSEVHIAYADTRYTGDCIRYQSSNGPVKHYRLRLPCEALSYELKGIAKDAARFYYTMGDFRALDLSDQYGDAPGETPPQIPTETKAYHEHADGAALQKRLVEHARSLYFDDEDGIARPATHKLFGELGPRGLKYEDYKLALTGGLLSAVFGNKLTPDVVSKLDTASISGYVPGTAIAPNLAGQYWMRTGLAGFSSNANQHFYLPEEYTDPFGNLTTLQYDARDLFVQSSKDALGNTSGVAVVPPPPATGRPRFDYRVLAPIEMVDANGNRTEVVFDILSMVVASAVKGKGVEADDLIGFDSALANPSAAAVQEFCADREMNVQTASDWLGNATARFVYHFGEGRDNNGNFTGWADRPAGACGIVRERHASQVARNPFGKNPIQVALECSDGGGNVLMKKVQAEPASGQTELRWIVNGLTVLNNKGKPVKQYEPDFSEIGFGCETPPAKGVTPVIYYDAAGRVVRTEMSDGTFSQVEFSPWHVKTFDANDTVLESRWHRERLTAAARGVPLHRPGDSPQAIAEANDAEVLAQRASAEDKRAAHLAAAHADTPSQTHLDSLGREVIAIAHNRTQGVDDKYLTFTKLDAEGKPLWIRDALGNLVMQYITPAKPTRWADQANEDLPSRIDPTTGERAYSAPAYDIAGNLLFQHSMDAGDRWMLMDAAGKPMLAWDMNETPQGTAATREDRFYSTDYDKLHRPTAQWLTINNASRIMVERYEYRDNKNPDGTPNSQLAQDKAANLIGQLVRHYDPSGLVETIRRDFKGNVQEVRRTLNNAPDKSVIDWQTNPAGRLESETYVQLTEHDALNRMTRLYNWHLPEERRIAIYLPRYNKRGALASEYLVMHATSYDPDTGTLTTAIQEIRYNAKGQKEYLRLGNGALGNGTVTRYDYDEKTFRLRQLRTTRPIYSPPFPQYRSDLKDTKVLQQLHYTYDPVGNISEITDEAYKPAFFQNALIEPRCLYEYDALYRLTKASGRESGAATGAPQQIEGSAEIVNFPVMAADALRKFEQDYQYDPVGNIKKMHHSAGLGTWTRTYQYALDSNRLAGTDTDNPLKAIAYRYDTHGNMLNLANVPDEYRLQWDHRDMIRSINLGGGGTAHYQYDSGKQRTRKRIVNQNNLGGYWERIYLGGYERYRRYNGNGSTLVEEIESHHLFEGAQRVLLVDDVITASDPITHSRPDGLTVTAKTLFRYQYSNHLGSSSLELDESAEIISYEEYHPYGTSAYRLMKSGIEAPAKRYRYTGMERDEESGLGYHGARYYALWIGRWISCDPKGVLTSAAFYEYCRNLPIRFLDRNGHEPTEEEKKTMDNLIAWQQKNKPDADRLSAILAAHQTALDRGDQQAANTHWNKFGSEYGRQVRQLEKEGLQKFGKQAAVATVAALGWEAGVAIAAILELSALTSLVFAGLTSSSTVVTYDAANRKVSGEAQATSKETAATVLLGMALPIVMHGTSRLVEGLGATPKLGPLSHDEVTAVGRKLAAAPGQRVFYAGAGNGGANVAEVVAIRTNGNQISFDTLTEADYVRLALEVVERTNPGSHVYVGSGTHGDPLGGWSGIESAQVKASFFREDLATLAPGQLPGLGPRQVINVGTSGGAATFNAAEQTASSVAPGSMTTVRAWCYSTLSVKP